MSEQETFAEATERRRLAEGLQHAVAALEAFYNGIIRDKDTEIARLNQEVERLAALATRLRTERIN